MPQKKKSWQEKLRDNKDLPKVMKIEGKMTKKWGTGTMVVPAPLDVDAIMRKVRKGKLITINGIRDVLQKSYDVDVACPITTGIFAWIAAHAADEAAGEGKKRITPYWRTLKGDGEINAKYPGGAEAVAKLLEAEGHSVIQKGKRLLVEDFDRSLAKVKAVAV